MNTVTGGKTLGEIAYEGRVQLHPWSSTIPWNKLTPFQQKELECMAQAVKIHVLAQVQIELQSERQNGN